VNKDEFYVYKRNLFAFIVGLASLAIHIFMTVRIWRHKNKETI
jgi:hypothetical protein